MNDQSQINHYLDELTKPSAPPLPPSNALPSTPDALRTECEMQRVRIIEAMRQGQRFYPCTNANFAALLKGNTHGHLLPSFERLWHAATALDIKNLPSYPGEPQTALEAVADLDSLLAVLAAPTPPVADDPSANSGTKAEPKRRGGRRRLEQSNPLKTSAYEYIRRARWPDEPYTDLANRLKHDEDFMDMARGAGVTRITYKTIRNAIEHEKQRHRDSAKKEERDSRKKQETHPA